MDGYAVRAADTRSASAAGPVQLEVLGEIRAGVAPPSSIKPSTALRIMTGAVMPEGADAVVRVEDTVEREGRVEIRVAVEPDASVRHAGSDIRRGDRVAERGRIVTPGLIGVLASTGRTSVPTFRRPRVTVLTTGDELRDANADRITVELPPLEEDKCAPLRDAALGGPTVRIPVPFRAVIGWSAL